MHPLRLAVPLSLCATLAAAATAPYRQTLTSVERNKRAEKWQITSKEVTPRSKVPWSVRKVTLHGGKQEGVDLIHVDNGKIRFTVCPTRGMGLISASRGDLRLGWDSPVKEIVHPQYVNLQARGGLGWLDGFNEWMCRCGLENNGGPGTDRFINNVGDEATMDLTLHGKIANLPAQEVEVVVDREPPYTIHIRGTVHERMFYGPKLELRTDISTVPGSDTLRVKDVITNRGAQPQEFQILYHTNFGRPLLEQGATFAAPVARVIPMNDVAARAINNYPKYLGPTLGFVEQVYCMYPRADASGRSLAILQNRARNQAASVRYSVTELPYLTLWKNTAATNDGYVTGIEPGTNFPNTRSVERKLGRVPKLGPGASYSIAVDFGLHSGTSEVQALTDEIAAIQGDHRPVLEPRPEKKD